MNRVSKRGGPGLAEDDPEFRARLEQAVGANYQIAQLIGEGGFGRVYAAHDVRLDRQVAIKVIRPDVAGARIFSDRFRKEAMALAKFRHPGIVPIYDIQESDGLVYFVMPLIGGDTLRARLQKHRAIAPQEARKMLVDLCQCLAATHRAGIVHRDIKPDNIILESDAMARGLLMDFGIAKSVAELSETTDSGMIMGTPTYMSPEQMNGDGVVDHRSDIYSVGVLGYHMLTGRPPFVGAMTEVAFGHMTKTPDSIRKLNPSVPLAMADALERCLNKNPEDRYQSAGELAGELNRVTFSEDTGHVEQKVNYAFPFFLGLTIATLAFGLLGAERLQFLPQREWMLIAGGLALLAITCSPMVRVWTDGLHREARARWQRRNG